ncbi:broad specificity phosphatase PhoE [Paraburkholderia bannensis]|uniref:Broad specificity phosphatase PhoE n=1 Tax=Paraburkholderia bannensis TaxID=765414 RepID=A0A7W9TT40_9BURK|nr:MULTISPECIES: histidine phosphatase family protein [Paraburkholderia]MBB3255867.1 broad specificity phosphatase PhoE [Paraburkholderia sp. WP4_3_2]MBB6100867.1 broad specificity phosphatase PhoE [Paraburkholderia bannensis]
MMHSRHSLSRFTVMLAAHLFPAAGVFFAGAGAVQAASAPDNADVTTLIFVRHGEKPAEGLGQLNCKGLNRALALPAVIAAKYGKPDAVYAPDPGEQKDDGGHAYYYVRPLATVEPTAIQFGLPIQTPYGHSHTEALEKTLLDTSQRNRTVVIGWEHREIETMVRKIVAEHGGSASDVPSWKSADFDSIYVVRVDWSSGTPRVRFSHEREDLDGVSDACPCAGLPAPTPPAQ